MENFLIKHAIDNVWCNPDQDNQLIFKAFRLTKFLGELNRFKLMNRQVELPSQGKFYHVYQIGQLDPKVMGLFSKNPDWVKESWTSFKDVSNTLKLIVSIYTAKGVTLPLFKSYYMFTKERDLIFAIEIDSRIKVDLDFEDVYFRFYTNAYYQSARSDANDDYIYVQGQVVVDTAEILTLQQTYLTYSQKPGYTYVFKNGYLVNKVDLFTIQPNDIVELIYDSSVKSLAEFKISDLLTFNSELDDKYKYLLHPIKNQEAVINYQDDIDIFISYKNIGLRTKGFYYHRNNLDSHRMVTHRDYSVVPDYVEYIGSSLIEALGLSVDIRDLYIQVIIKKSGYDRPLIYDNNRIFELYKLDDEKIIQAMVGLNATVNEWKAETLENSAYTALMRDDFTGVTIEDIQSAYGYNGLSKVVGNTPMRTYNRGLLKQVDVPVGLYENSTAYEYDESGKLLGWYHHLSGSDYECSNNTTEYVEMISGKGSHRPEVVYGIDQIDLPIINNYRVYMTFVSGNVISPNWADITGTDLYRVENNKLIWNDHYTGQYLMVRSDKTFLAYDLELDHVAGTYYFTLSEEVVSDLRNGEQVLQFPLGELDIFLNDRPAIKGLDYIVKFPKIYIVNKTFLKQPVISEKLKVHVRFTGFCNRELEMEEIDDYGFIEHGFLSNNHRYDIRDDKVLRITVNGQFKDRWDLQFSEEHDGISIVNSLNGQPYQIKDIIVPLKQLVNENTYSLRDKALLIDKHVSDYMTIKLPQPDRNAVSSIYQRYVLVSPFFCHLIFDMATGQFNSERLLQNLSDGELIEICQPYEFLLDFDPVNEIHRIDMNYVDIHPHSLNTVIPLTIYQYRFLLRVVKIYGNDRIDIASFVSINQE